MRRGSRAIGRKPPTPRPSGNARASSANTSKAGGDASSFLARPAAPGGPPAPGAATGRNPLSIVVPCHRVIGTDGSLTGYAGGIGRKTRLLEIEGALHGALV
jgi:methylated-DNA-[protein]-cysteine S-methyltransferase